jgi:hypothetical protein
VFILGVLFGAAVTLLLSVKWTHDMAQWEEQVLREKRERDGDGED